jgi:hypothetical protein
LRGVSKDRRESLVAHPSRLALKKGEHLRMTAELAADASNEEHNPGHDEWWWLSVLRK